MGVASAMPRGGRGLAGTGDEVRYGCEILDVDNGRLEHLERIPDHAGHFGVLELDVDPVAVPASERRPAAGVHWWRSQWGRMWAAIAAAFVLGAGAGAASFSADGDPPVVIAGHAAVAGVAEGVSAGTAAVPIVVSLHAPGPHDVEIVSVRPRGWPVADPNPEPQSAPAGQWRSVRAAVRLDCRAPMPQAASALEVQVRTTKGEDELVLPLPGGIAGLGEVWREFCPAPTRPPRGLIP